MAGSVLALRIKHSGILPDGKPNRESVLLPDIDSGQESISRKNTVYVPVGGTVIVPFTSHTQYSYQSGSINGFVRLRMLLVDFVFLLRNTSDHGGPLGTGVPFAATANPNIDVFGGRIRILIDGGLDTAGVIPGERAQLSGLAGVFAQFNRGFTINQVFKDEDLNGNPDPRWIRVELVTTVGNLAGQQQPGDLDLIDGKVTIAFSSAGNAANMGSTIAAYFGSDIYVSGGVDPTWIQFTQDMDRPPPDWSLYLTSQDLYWKGTGGVSWPVIQRVEDLKGTQIGLKADGDVLTWNAGLQKWINAVGGGGGGPAKSVLHWGNSSVTATTTTRYLSPGWEDGLAPSTVVRWEAPFAGTLQNLRIRHNQPLGNGNLLGYTVRVNGVASLLAVPLASTGVSGSNVVNTAVVAAGDLLDIQVTKALDIGVSPGDVMASLELLA